MQDILVLFDKAFSNDYGIDLNRISDLYNTQQKSILVKYGAVINSESWKITKPLRLIGKFLRWFKTSTTAWITFSPQSRPRRVTKKVLIKTREELIKRPKLKSLVKKFLKPFPNLENRLKKIGKERVLVSKDNQNDIILSPRARQIYNDLKRLCEVKDENSN